MQFGIPQDNIIRSPREGMPERPLRAEGNLNYEQFIKLLKDLWEEIYPDIPILPVQGKTYTNYPVVVYSLENRKPHASEPKQRYREEIVTDGEKSYIVSGQRFDNFIAFSAITDNEPELAERIIERFEGFVLEHTPVFKRRGLSEILYSRRLSDREETRAGEDVCIRTVVYMCVIERITQIAVEKIQEILTNISVTTAPLGNYAYVPSAYETEDGAVDLFATDQAVNLAHYPLQVGDVIRVLPPAADDLMFQPQDGTKIIPGTNIIVEEDKFPGGITSGKDYTVSAVDEDLFKLQNLSDSTPVDITGTGWFRYALIKAKKGKSTVDLDDSDQPTSNP